MLKILGYHRSDDAAATGGSFAGKPGDCRSIGHSPAEGGPGYGRGKYYICSAVTAYDGCIVHRTAGRRYLVDVECIGRRQTGGRHSIAASINYRGQIIGV